LSGQSVDIAAAAAAAIGSTPWSDVGLHGKKLVGATSPQVIDF